MERMRRTTVGLEARGLAIGTTKGPALTFIVREAQTQRKIGALKVGAATVTWTPAYKHSGTTLSWERFAQLFAE